jgi:hypothetical protein
MRRLGTHDTGLTSSSPSVCVVIYDGVTSTPSLCLTQEAFNDLPSVKVHGTAITCLNVLDDVTIKSVLPTTAGG